MSQRKLIAGISALLTCLVIVAGCQRYPTPEGGVPDAGSTQDSDTTAGSGTVAGSDPTTPPPVAATETPTGGPTSDGTGGNSNGGAGGQKATGSPIDVPTIPDPHTSMDGLRAAIEGAFVDACGGQELCVKLQYGTGACLLGYDPKGKVLRGSTVEVLTESQQDCDAANGVTPPSSDGSNGASSSTGSGDGSGSG